MLENCWITTTAGTWLDVHQNLRSGRVSRLEPDIHGKAGGDGDDGAAGGLISHTPVSTPVITHTRKLRAWVWVCFSCNLWLVCMSEQHCPQRDLKPTSQTQAWAWEEKQQWWVHFILSWRETVDEIQGNVGLGLQLGNNKDKEGQDEDRRWGEAVAFQQFKIQMSSKMWRWAPSAPNVCATQFGGKWQCYPGRRRRSCWSCQEIVEL